MQTMPPLVKRDFLASDLLSECLIQLELLGNVVTSAGFGLVLVAANRASEPRAMLASRLHQCVRF